MCDPLWMWTHFPAGEHRTAVTGARLKSFGLQPGWPDFILVSPRGQAYFMELKRIGGVLSESQESFRVWAIKLGIPYVVAHTLQEAITAFGAWKCVKE